MQRLPMQHQPHALLVRDLLAPQEQHAARDLPHDLRLDAGRVPDVMQRLPCRSRLLASPTPREQRPVDERVAGVADGVVAALLHEQPAPIYASFHRDSSHWWRRRAAPRSLRTCTARLLQAPASLRSIPLDSPTRRDPTGHSARQRGVVSHSAAHQRHELRAAARLHRRQRLHARRAVLPPRVEPRQLLHGGVHVHRARGFELHPAHRARLLRRRAVVRVRHQQRRDELLRLLAHRAPRRLVELKRPAHHQPQRREVVRLRKRRVPAQPTLQPKEPREYRMYVITPSDQRSTAGP